MKRLSPGWIAAAIAAATLAMVPACQPTQVEPRVFAVGLRQDLAGAESYATYADRMAEVMAVIAPNFAADRRT